MHMGRMGTSSPPTQDKSRIETLQQSTHAG